jgi:hypothetical protein
MARQKVTNRVPPITSTRRAGSAWDREFLGQTTYGRQEQTPVNSIIPNRGSFGDAQALQNNVRQSQDILTAQEIQMALIGNDRPLLPYQPTPTINPGRPRTLAAGYDERTQTLRIKFRDGEIYEYYQVPPSVWWKFQRAQSPGRYINTALNRYPYSRGLL